jgi:hypothetical protein
MSNEQIVAPDQEQTKLCRRCDKVKPLSDFGTHKRSKGGKRSCCKICARKWDEKYENNLRASGKHKMWRRRKRLRDHYGITLEEYEAIEKAHGGICAICGKPETTRDKYGLKRLAIDHCHITNKIRGLLCYHCNTGLGHFRDNPQSLQNAISYLQKQ